MNYKFLDPNNPEDAEEIRKIEECQAEEGKRDYEENMCVDYENADWYHDGYYSDYDNALMAQNRL